MAQSKTDTKADAGERKKSKRTLFIAIAAVVVALSGGGGAYYMSQAEAAEGEAVAEAPAKKKKKRSAAEREKAMAARVWVQYSAITANLAQGSGVLQATVDVQVTDESAKERIEKARPLVLAKVLDTFSAVSYEEVVDPKVKAQLADDIKAHINEILDADTDDPAAQVVVFSTYISMPS